MAADPKPRRRLKLTKYRYNQLAGNIIYAANKGGGCECGCGRRAETVHHVVRRGHGDDIRENLMALAGDGTRLCHGAITSKHRVWDAERSAYILPGDVLAGMRERMETVRLDVLDYVLGRRGRDFLEKQYPRVST